MIKNFNLKGRVKALLVHLLFSLFVFACFMYVMLAYWFPMPHFQINGGWQGTRIMVWVDLVIGPFLTFILYNNKKPKRELRLDLSIIVLIQTALLIYGMEKVFSQRPVVQVISHRGYIATPIKEDLVYQTGVKPLQLIDSFNLYNVYPPMVYSVYESYYKSKSPFEDMFSTKIDESFKGDLSPEKIVSRYRPVNSIQVQVDLPNATKRAMKRFSLEPNNKKAIAAYKKQNGDSFYFFPLLGRYGSAIIVLDKISLKPIDYFNVEFLTD